ncbi:MAG: hypothetical protein ACLSCV_03185 [Acutalibacteraceae bacterium]
MFPANIAERVTCPSCSISLTYHSANNRLMSCYCGYSVPFTKECPSCHEQEVRYAVRERKRRKRIMHIISHVF